MSEKTVSDKALSILAFAAYHALASGETVGEIVIDDGHGHVADPQGLAEMQEKGLLEADGRRARLTEEGSTALASVLDTLRSAKI